MEYFVYIIKSLKKGVTYKGQTNNLERRLYEHTLDQYDPYELIYVQICKNRSAAVILERFFKTGYGREIIQLFLDP